MLNMPKINWTWELLPRLERILSSRNIQISRINAWGSHVGYASRWAIFVAKSKLWRNQVSTQKELIDKCNQQGRWIIFWIPWTGALKFDPARLLEKGWRNMRDSEEMINIDIKYGSFTSWDDLDIDPLRRVEQLSLMWESEKTKEIVKSWPPVQVNNIMTSDSPVIAELKSWRQRLGAVMAEYAKKFKLPLWEVERQVYKKYSVWSRTELSTDELQAEYHSYKTALDRAIA
jgi:hypothetical protein